MYKRFGLDFRRQLSLVVLVIKGSLKLFFFIKQSSLVPQLGCLDFRHMGPNRTVILVQISDAIFCPKSELFDNRTIFFSVRNLNVRISALYCTLKLKD